VRRILGIAILAIAFGAPAALGHEVMGPVQVNQILKSIQQSRAILDGKGAAAEKEEALFDIGVDAYALMKLINSEIKEHGAAENAGLISLAISRCKAMGVNIDRTAAGDFYVYDFDAFTTYRKMAPRGKYTAEAKFALIEKSFYDQREQQRTPELLLKQVQEKQELLKEYPKLTRRADLEMFIILDYLELHSIYLEKNDAARSEQYKKEMLDLCKHVIDNYPDTEAANFARDLLIKLSL
jgi:hypothetical protein